MKNFQKSARVLLCLTLLSACAFSQQSPTTTALPHDFDYMRYDSVAPALPHDYPAKHYSVDELVKRLVEIAQGPELKRDEMEREFGLRFVRLFSNGPHLFVARGQAPLGRTLSKYSDFRDGKKGTLFISLDFRGLDPSDATKPASSAPMTCIQNEQFFQQLGNEWIRSTREHPYRAFYTRSTLGHKTTVETFPAYGTRQTECIYVFSLTYQFDGLEKQ